MERINQNNYVGTRANRYKLAKIGLDQRLEECVQPPD